MSSPGRQPPGARGQLAGTAVLLVLGPALLAAISLAAESLRLRSAEKMAQAADRFLASLAPAQRAQALFPLEDPERFDWNFVPRSRRGLPLKDLDPAQRRLAEELLRAGLSSSGYRKASDIMALEAVLREIEGSPRRDPDRYYFSLFGSPSGRSAWGWRFEGHHLSLNYTLAGGIAVSHTPSFFGANPATVGAGALSGKRALAGEEDRARELLRSLDERQRAAAVFRNVAPSEIVTGNAAKVDPLAPAGIAVADLEPPQRDLFIRLLEEYLSRMPEDIAGDRREKLRAAGFEKIRFAWAGGAEPGQPHYYRIQGPTFLIEYDDTQDGANHIHTVWRDFAGDFGRDLLGEHYQAVPHSP
ncbi:MAG: DUF3500 domain-containing protein [Acidobacteriota bacterium]